MAQIAVDFLLGTGLSSHLIAWFGYGSGGYSHCASVIVDERHGERYLDARNDVIAGVPPGVHIREISTEKWIKKRRATLEVTQPEYDAWEANLRAKITDGYGRDDILDFIDEGERHANGRYICSALAINAVQHISRSWTAPHVGFVPYPLYVPAHQISPDSCLLALQTAGFTIGAEQFFKVAPSAD
jgi:hypothetical protein